QARSDVAALIGADPMEVVFTSGGTESDNLALRGAFDTFGPSGRIQIVTSGIEHEAVLNTAKALAARGAQVTTLPAGRDGLIDSAVVEAATGPSTAIGSVMLANNEIGTIPPVGGISAGCRPTGALIHTDAGQAAGKTTN